MGKTKSNTKPGTTPKQMTPILKTITPGKASKNLKNSKQNSKTQKPHSVTTHTTSPPSRDNPYRRLKQTPGFHRHS
jgi:hypothetical protein